MSTPILQGGRHIVLQMSASVSVSASLIAKGTPAQFFFWDARFLFPRALAFDFCYDLDLCSQGQAERGFFPNFVKSIRGILIKRVRKLHRQVAHDLIMLDLQLTYFYIYCVVLKLPNL